MSVEFVYRLFLSPFFFCMTLMNNIPDKLGTQTGTGTDSRYILFCFRQIETRIEILLGLYIITESIKLF